MKSRIAKVSIKNCKQKQPPEVFRKISVLFFEKLLGHVHMLLFFSRLNVLL